jgi:tRNA 2-thiouridine synthesizing protein A
MSDNVHDNENKDQSPEMKVHLLDCVGLYCPLPVMRAREEIDKLEPGALLEIVADDPAAEEDIPRWARRTGNSLQKSWVEEGELHFLVRKEREANHE